MDRDNATTCVLCGEPMTAADMRNAAEQVTGFALSRKGGGANQIALRQGTGKFAHHICVRTYDQRFQGSML